MKVLRVADVPSSPEAGVSGAMIHGGEALRHLGVQVDYMFRDEIGTRPADPRLRRLLAPWLVVARIVRRQVAGTRYDLVEIHEPLAAAYCAIAGALGMPPCTVLSHGLEIRYWKAQLARWRALQQPPSLKRRITVPLTILSQARYALMHADHIIVLTADDLDYLVASLHIDRARISRVDNGAPTMSQRRQAQPSSCLRILFLGSWIDRKGSRELVQASTFLAESGISFHLTVAGCGTGEVLSSFPASVQSSLTIIARVRRSELKRLLSEQDVLAAPSWAEGMPLSVLEAAAGGLALVLTDISGHRQILAVSAHPDKSAVIVPPHDGYQLGAALLALSTDYQRLVQLQEEARSLAATLTWDRAALQLLAAYKATITHRPKRHFAKPLGTRLSTRHPRPHG